MALDTAFDKRLVMHHSTGLLTGLNQIVGRVSMLPEAPPAEFPRPDGHKMIHWRTKPRYVAYREWAQQDTHEDLDVAQR